MNRPDSGWVAIENVQPVFDRLIAIYGSKAQVAAAMGLHKQGFLHPDKELIQRKTLNKALDLLAEHEGHLIASNIPLLVVSSAKVSEQLRKWCVEFMATHDYRYEKTMGPTQVIAELSHRSVRVISRYINDDGDGRLWVDVKPIDNIFTAIDLQHLLSDGTIPVVPNPGLTMEAWIRRMEQRGCI